MAQSTYSKRFHPASFAVYPDDPRRTVLEVLLKASGMVCLFLFLVPFTAGPSNELSLPVFYARVELNERAPVVLELDLPGEDYSVQPASLGHFTQSGEFVFSAEVARGLIYGRNNGELLVVEVIAPPEAGLYIDRQLELIRTGVNELNQHDNLLMLARGEAPKVVTAAQQLADSLWVMLGSELAGPIPPEWLEEVEWQYDGNLNELESALLEQARHLAQLKRLYYESQAARLNLLLAQYDLQIALARLPSPEIDELLSLGDATLVRRTMLDEIERLRSAWQSRRDKLARQATGNLKLIEGRAAPEPEIIPDTPLDAILEKVHASLLPPEPAQAPIASGLASPARLMACQAQLVVANAEAEMIKLRLAELDTAAEHVELGAVPSWTRLPRHAPRLKRLRMAGLEELNSFAAAEHAARSPCTAAPLLLALARCFEAESAETAGTGQETGTEELTELAAGIEADAVAYGLLVVDRCRLGPVPGGNTAEGRGDTGADLLADLAEMIENPDDYGAASCNLGYLEFMHWYAGLERERDERIFDRTTSAEVAADDTAAGEDAEGSDGEQADIDKLLN